MNAFPSFFDGARRAEIESDGKRKDGQECDAEQVELRRFTRQNVSLCTNFCRSRALYIVQEFRVPRQDGTLKPFKASPRLIGGNEQVHHFCRIEDYTIARKRERSAKSPIFVVHTIVISLNRYRNACKLSCGLLEER